LLCVDEESGFQYTLCAKQCLGLGRIWAVRQALEGTRAVIAGNAVILTVLKAVAGPTIILTALQAVVGPTIILTAHKAVLGPTVILTALKVVIGPTVILTALKAVIGPIVIIKKKTPWSESASELYRPSDRRLSAK
jgi:hypothetical protein